MLDFGVDTHRAAHFGAFGFGQSDHFVQGRDGEQAVINFRTDTNGLDGPQCFDFGQGEVTGEECRFLLAIHVFGGLAGWKLGCDIGGAIQHRLVTGNHRAIFGQDQIGLNVICLLVNGGFVGLQSLGLAQMTVQMTARRQALDSR